MTDSPELAGDQPNQAPQNTYFAVRPDLVLKTMQWFRIQPSILEKGARKLFDKARKIDEGKETGRWGHHHQSIIELFCVYTQEQGNVLPWKELVESGHLYDGEEGVSTRTGNKPLSTVVRMQIDGRAVANARIDQGYEQSDLARETSLPIAFLQAIESGEWETVTQATAEHLTRVLKAPMDIATPLTIVKSSERRSVNQHNNTSEPFDDSDGAPKMGRLRHAYKVVIAIAAIGLGFALYFTTENKNISYAGKEYSAPIVYLDESQSCLASGVYAGTFSGDDNGRYLLWIQSQRFDPIAFGDTTPRVGVTSALVFSTDENLVLGVAPRQGLSFDTKKGFISGVVSTGARFIGELANNYTVIHGEWQNSVFGDSGAFIGSRKAGLSTAAHRISAFFNLAPVGTPFSADGSGLIALDVFADNTVSGVAVTLRGDEQPLTGTLANGIIFVSSANTTFTMNFDADGSDPGNDPLLGTSPGVVGSGMLNNATMDVIGSSCRLN